IHQITTLPTLIENIAVRPNGHLLLTSLGNATMTMYTINPTCPQPSASILQIAPGSNGISGITEILPDIYAFLAGTWNTSIRRAELGSLSIYALNLRTETPVVKKIVTIAESVGLNGLATVPGSKNLLLASDSVLGAVWRIDISKGTYDLAIKDSLFAPTGPAPSLGINGIRTKDNHFYFANSAQGVFGRVAISALGKVMGPVDVLTRIDASVGSFDDFALDSQGNAWMALHPKGLYFVDMEGKQKKVVNETLLPDPTSARFGRRDLGLQHILYVT
ncbi:uncharacterized protein BDR25DRAFT_199454, partial [Lindgomyces ingoldianus]